MDSKGDGVDRDPAVISFLRRVRGLERLDTHERQQLVHDAELMLLLWNQNEDIDQLRDWLGVTLAPNRRPSQKIAQRQIEIAIEFLERERAGEKGIAETLGEKYGCHADTARAYKKNWHHLAEKVLAAFRPPDSSKTQ